MILLIIIVISFILAIIIFHGVSGIENKTLKKTYLLIIGFVIQAVIFNEKFANSQYQKYTAILYILSLIILLSFMLYNLEYIGMRIMALGFGLNIAVIIVNQGYMPQSARLLLRSGQYKKLKMLQLHAHFYNATLMGKNTHLNLLGDRIMLSLLGKFKTVYSIGDLIIILGIAVFVFELFKRNSMAREKTTEF